MDASEPRSTDNASTVPLHYAWWADCVFRPQPIPVSQLDDDGRPGAPGWARQVLAQGRALDAAVSLLREGAPDFDATEALWQGRPAADRAADRSRRAGAGI